MFGTGGLTLGVGHLAKGTLSQSLGNLARHPVWGTRADFAVARDTIMGRPNPSLTKLTIQAPDNGYRHTVFP